PGNSNRESARSSPAGTSRFCPAICRALFARGRRAGICRVQKKFDSFLARLAVIRRAKQIRATSVQSQRNCVARGRNWEKAMEATEHAMKSWDGTELYYRAWIPREATNKAIVLFHLGH